MAPRPWKPGAQAVKARCPGGGYADKSLASGGGVPSARFAIKIGDFDPFPHSSPILSLS